MGTLRHWLRSHSLLALGLIAFALAIKAFVPQGYMVAPGKSFAVTLCTGMGAASATLQLPADPTKPAGHPDGKTQDQACPFGALAHAAAPGASLELLVAAIAFLLALGFAAAVPPPLRRAPYLSPPLRGPPATA